MRIERELMRGAGPVAVLKLLQSGEMYGYEIVEAISARSDGVLAIGQSTLYPMLYNLQAKKLIKARWSDDAPRRRKYYALTDKGRKRLAKETNQWRALAKAMTQIGILPESSAAAMPREAIA